MIRSSNSAAAAERAKLEREISRGIAVDAELDRQRQRAEQAEAERDALKAATERVRAIKPSPEVGDTPYNRAVDRGWDEALAEVNRALDHPTDTTEATP